MTNNNNSKRNVRIAGLVFSLIFGFIVMSATTVNAQNRNNRRNENRTDRRDDSDRNNRDRDDRDDDDNDDYDNNRNNNRNDNNVIKMIVTIKTINISRQAYRAGYIQGQQDARNGRRIMLIAPPDKQCAE